MFKPKQPYFGLKGGWLTLWITIACATDMSLFGYDQGVFSGVVISKDYLNVHNLNGPDKTDTLAIVTAIYDIGCFLGAIVAFWIGEKIGRKRTIFIGTSIMAVGAALQISSYSVGHMIVGRIVSGVGNGINTATAPVWQTETSQAKWRGKLVVLEMMMNILGFMTVNWINYGLSFVGGAIAWRLPLALQYVFIFVLWATVPWLPESPRWLIAHGRDDEAIPILASLENKSTEDPYVKAQYEEIRFGVEYEREHAIRWRDLLRGRTQAGTKTVRRLLLGAGTQAMQQFGGINIMSYYLPTLLISSVDLSDSMARLIAATSAVVYLIASGIAAPLVERYGRRIMMMVSTAIQFFCFLLMTILLYFANDLNRPDHQIFGKASVVWFFIYYIGFGLGMLGIPWLYPTEINSLPMRTKGAAVATATNWITNFIVVEVTPRGLQNLGWRFYIVWTVLNAAFMPIIYFFYPETADRTLEDVDAYYRENPPLIVIGDKDSISRKRPAKFVKREEADVETATHSEGPLARTAYSLDLKET
ncbi:general substrate transporter [Lindgomyces ingoldianus]|uniref:General substrate transporter n=1 Tax=Lindgomyces ingoldianus TaxID=673940 RepID=A0ACB6Q9I0_9PLEO|nr:general substrate transporter [Lindgomyces ingoldianus]KAF2463556.1 general substrate transporter [Lindgomyces ingoldianus]